MTLIDDWEAQYKPSPFVRKPRANPVDHLNAIRAQGTDSTARAAYVNQRIQDNAASQRETDLQRVQTATDTVAQSSLDDSQANADNAQSQADSQRAANDQAANDADIESAKVQSVGAISSKDSSGVINQITDKAAAARQLVDEQSAAAAMQSGSHDGSTNTAGKTSLRQQLVAAVARQKGVDYSWGGGTDKGPSKGFGKGANTVGFDCSSLVKYAYAKIGIKMPRVSDAQEKMGVRVPMNRLEPGDLVAHPGHIAIFAGNGMMWESPHTGSEVRLVPVRRDMYGIHVDLPRDAPQNPGGTARPGQGSNSRLLGNAQPATGFGKFLQAIGQKESGGSYTAINADTGASGKYQIMPNNIGPWGQEALGRRVTVQEFRSSPQVQETIAQYKLKQYHSQYGAQGAAIAWYAGPGAAAKFARTGRASNNAEGGGKYPSVAAYGAAIARRSK